ncbi:ABC transporter ATP-binding protein/permease [Clostridium sp. CX1]|uniref:ABC transporter ATP-binding protein n=1 Tax=Clostridium sp. CX1 TaxID=2978346 RepID=UPI0021C017DF|nr:ABC transporter ATP-binding protein [Clostridium sp. CX1]MCT8978058.1 ABC transporter ATP-binding protein/permease [Clostridium sp. CX1]
MRKNSRRLEYNTADSEKVVKKNNSKMTKRLMKYILPHWKGFLLSLMLILIVSAASLARPYIIKVAIDSYIKRGLDKSIPVNSAVNSIKILAFVYFSLMLLEFILSYFQAYILQSTGKKIIMRLREDIFNHLQKLPVAYFDKNPVGKIVTRVTNDTDSLNDMFTDVGIGFLQNVFIMSGIIVVMINLNSTLTVICLLVTPLMFLATLSFKKRAKSVFREIRAKLALINSFISENVPGMKIIQIFNMENKKYEEFNNINKDFYDSSLKQIVLFGVFRPFMDVVKTLSLALILLYGGTALVKGTIEVGTLYAFINYINRLFQPIIELTDQYNTYQSSMISAEKIFDLLDEETEKQPQKEEKLSEVKGEIQFRNVWFAYEGTNWVLKDISFNIGKGQSAAFVGTTGAGKTSIINLICGFYQHQRGEILIDGISIKNIKKEDLRKNIGLILQDVFLFAGDIETNIRLYSEDISLDDVKKAAEYVNAGYFIENLSEGYKHQVKEKGVEFSMGQRQLLSFARALVHNPAILVMDEATSNIDTETEATIHQVVEKLMNGRTSIRIAHRLSTVRNVDKIIVLDKGQIVEIGSHQELMQREGFYSNLYKLQYKGII